MSVGYCVFRARHRGGCQARERHGLWLDGVGFSARVDFAQTFASFCVILCGELADGLLGAVGSAVIGFLLLVLYLCR